MSRQEQNDRHIIWSDISLDLDDWRESLEELYPGYSDDELYDIMVKSNAENLYDERVNLNIQLSQPIIVIGDLGRWNGRVSGYKMIDSGNIKDCLYWENGSSLALNINEDTFEKVEAPEKISVILVEPGRYPKLKKKSLLRTVQMKTPPCSQNCYQIRKQQHY